MKYPTNDNSTSPKKRSIFLKPLTKLHLQSESNSKIAGSFNSYDSNMVWPTTDSVTKKDIDKKHHIQCKYVLCRVSLGTGSYSTVIEGKHIETGLHYAIKKIPKKLMNGREQLIQNEFKVLQKVSSGHKNILNLIDFFETDDDLFIVTDLALGGELFDKILSLGSFFEEDAIGIIRSVVSGTCYLHDNNIVHRDLKAENLLFKTSDKMSDLLIADFGLAKILDLDNLNCLMTKCGTLSYMAPEIFQKTGHGFAVDMWSLGVVTYFILCGYMPFDCETDDETKEAILKADYMYEPVEYWEHISSDAKDFIDKCFKLDPQERLTAREALHHPFLNNKEAIHKKQFPERLTKNPSFNLLPNVKSNVSLHKLGFSPRNSPLASPRHLSPSHSFIMNHSNSSISHVQNAKSNLQIDDYFQFHSSASQASLSRLKEAALEMYQHQQSQLPHMVTQTIPEIHPTTSSTTDNSVHSSSPFSKSNSRTDLRVGGTTITRESSYVDMTRKLPSKAEYLMNGALCFNPEYLMEFSNSLMGSRVGSVLNSRRISRNPSYNHSNQHSRKNSGQRADLLKRAEDVSFII